MRTPVTKRFRSLLCGTLLATTLPIAAAADQVFPPGTECANLPTIAERLLCGRQELKRGDAATQRPNQPPPPYDGWSPDPDQAQPPPPAVNMPTVPPQSPGDTGRQSPQP